MILPLLHTIIYIGGITLENGDVQSRVIDQAPSRMILQAMIILQ